MILSICVGLLFGFLGFKGIVSIILGVAATNVPVLLYVRHYLDLDDDDIENYQIYTEAFMPGFASFMLFWIAAFSTFHSLSSNCTLFILL